MKWIFYLVLLLGAALLPTEATDVGDLIPVEVIAISESQGIVTVETDMGDIGRGGSLQDAFSNLRDTASGIIYLDTAEYVLLEEGMEPQIPVLRDYLKDSVRICYGQEGISLDGIARYLDVHRPERRLSENGEIPVIVESNGRYQIDKK